jgi:hypothetical protein
MAPEPGEADDQVSIGTTVYDGDGTELGTIRGIDDDGQGLLVSLREGLEAMSASHVQAGGEFAPAELTWGCYQCGEIRRLEGSLPGECPDCGATREELYYRQED